MSFQRNSSMIDRRKKHKKFLLFLVPFLIILLPLGTQFGLRLPFSVIYFLTFFTVLAMIVRSVVFLLLSDPALIPSPPSHQGDVQPHPPYQQGYPSTPMNYQEGYYPPPQQPSYNEAEQPRAQYPQEMPPPLE